jgi:pimeloyl-ACP methyl ester carboxylesterase
MSDRNLDKTILLRDGRRLSFAEYGMPTGIPVFFFPGSAGSRLDRPASETIPAHLGIQLISTDRPGLGLSDIQLERRLLDWPSDVCHLADLLGIEQFYVLGHSAGGPHALACAYHLPERVLACAIVSSMAPMGRKGAYQGMPFPNQLLALFARHFPWGTRLIRRLMRTMVLRDTEKATKQLMASIPETDKAVLYSAENVDMMIASIQEGFRQGFEGVAADDILLNRDWGFSPGDIKPRVDIWHGDVDMNVPVHAALYLDNLIPNSRLQILKGKGHFFFLDYWEEILSMLLD